MNQPQHQSPLSLFDVAKNPSKYNRVHAVGRARVWLIVAVTVLSAGLWEWRHVFPMCVNPQLYAKGKYRRDIGLYEFSSSRAAYIWSVW